MYLVLYDSDASVDDSQLQIKEGNSNTANKSKPPATVNKTKSVMQVVNISNQINSLSQHPRSPHKEIVTISSKVFCCVNVHIVKECSGFINV